MSCLVSASCTYEVPGQIYQAVEPPAGAKKVSAHIGAFYSPEFKNYRQLETAGGMHKLAFNLGEWSVNYFDKVFREKFIFVDGVKHRPPVTRNDLDAVIEPRIEKVLIRNPGYLGWAGTHGAEISYLFILYALDGGILATWTVDGRGKSENTIDWTGFAGSDNAAEAVQNAMKDAGQKFLATFETQPEIRHWLNSQAP
jgi:hypothetical protein